MVDIMVDAGSVTSDTDVTGGRVEITVRGGSVTTEVIKLVIVVVKAGSVVVIRRVLAGNRVVTMDVMIDTTGGWVLTETDVVVIVTVCAGS